MKTRTAKLITFGAGGDAVELGRHCRITGYGNPDNPHAATPSADLIIPDGCPVVDKRAAVDTPEGFAWVFRGPLVDVDLPDNAPIDRCPEPSGIMARAFAESGNQYGQLLALQDAAPKVAAGPLDSVSIAEYVRGWREHGARIGQYFEGVIVWDCE